MIVLPISDKGRIFEQVMSSSMVLRKGVKLSLYKSVENSLEEILIPIYLMFPG